MTDSQYLFNLASRQYNETAEVIERHFENVADQIRDWIPGRIHILSPPPPPPPKPSLPLTQLAKLQSWALRHQAITAGLLAFVGSGAIYLYIQRNAYREKRRAKRALSGARTEVLVLAGSAMSPLTTQLALDLERRGFIVYVITSSQEEAQHVRNQSRADVLPFNLDLVYPENARDQVGKLHEMLSRLHHKIEGDGGHRKTLSGVVLIPDSHYQMSPMADISPESWSQALNVKILEPVLTMQQLLPLITEYSSKVLLLTPSIIPSLNPPNHALQSTISGALMGFSASLAAELALQNIPFTHFKLGHVDLGGRAAADSKRGHRGTPVRQLHDAVFDTLQSKRPWRTVHIGRGSLSYDLAGTWLPSSLVAWMMGLGKPESPKAERRMIEVGHGVGSDSAQWEKIDHGVERG